MWSYLKYMTTLQVQFLIGWLGITVFIPVETKEGKILSSKSEKNIVTKQIRQNKWIKHHRNPGLAQRGKFQNILQSHASNNFFVAMLRNLIRPVWTLVCLNILWGKMAHIPLILECVNASGHNLWVTVLSYKMWAIQ